MSPRVVAIGEPLVAFVAEDFGSFGTGGRWRSVVTGAEVNVSIGLARLGVTTSFVGPVGDDDLGNLVRRGLQAERVDVSGVQVLADTPTAALVRSRRLNGAGSVNYLRSDSAGSYLTLDPNDLEYIHKADIVHVSGITPALSEQAHDAITKALEAANSMVTLDINYRSRLWGTNEARAALLPLAKQSHTVFADTSEAQIVTGSTETDPLVLAKAVCAIGPSVCVMKLGPAGAAAYDKTNNSWHNYQGTPADSVIDPIGAGDAFVAGFIAATLEPTSLLEALQWGHICGSMCVGALGDTAGGPSRADLEQVLANGGDIAR